MSCAFAPVISTHAQQSSLLIPACEIDTNVKIKKKTLLSFEEGLHKGFLVYDQAKKVQAYLMNARGEFKRAELVSSFDRAQFSSVEQLNDFKASLRANYKLKILEIKGEGEPTFKVCLFDKSRGKILSDEEKTELESTKTIDEVGLDLYKKQRYDASIEQYKKSLAIRERLIPKSLEVARTYNIIGLSYYAQKKLKEALELFQRCVAIQERIFPESADIAGFYNNVGNVYYLQGKLEEALGQFQKCALVRQRVSPQSLEVSRAYHNMGDVYLAQGKLDKALEEHQKATTLQEIADPNGLDIAESYKSIGCVFEAKGMFHEALEYHKKDLVIKERLIPATLSCAASHHKVGLFYYAKRELDESLEQLQKGLTIRQQHIPQSLDTVSSYCSMGNVYLAQKKPEEALASFLKAYPIQKCILNPKSPDLLHLAHAIALTYLALSKPDYDNAILFAEKAIESDPTFKYAYASKGRALKGQKRLQESFRALEQALFCDPNYEDATILQLEVIGELTKKSTGFYSIAEDVVSDLLKGF